MLTFIVFFRNNIHSCDLTPLLTIYPFPAIPYFEVEPEVVNRAEGETAEFHCKAWGKPPPKQYWIYNGMPITDAPPNERRIVEPEKIIIYNLTKGDTGNYGCNATNEHGYVYKDVYVNVLGMLVLCALCF